MNEGYPTALLLFILLIGVPLAMRRPFWGLLLGVFCSLSLNSQMMTFTRFSATGAYFNASDACAFVVLVAMLASVSFHVSKLKVPWVIIFILLALLIGYFTSATHLGFKYEILRSLRWALTLPIFFIATGNLITDQERLKKMLVTLWAAGGAAAIGTIVFARAQASSHVSSAVDIADVRTISYSLVGLMIVMAAFIWFPDTSMKIRLTVLTLAPLILLAAILNQSRSVYIATGATLAVCLLWFRGARSLFKTIGIAMLGVVVLGGVLVLAGRLIPEISPAAIVQGRIETLTDPNLGVDDVTARREDIHQEYAAWSAGNPLFGQGLVFYLNALLSDGTAFVAWGHIGPVTVLAQLGLLGFLAYYLVFPWTMAKSITRLWRSNDQWQRYFAVVGGYTLVFSWGVSFMSSSPLDSNPMAGIIMGSLWCQALQKKEKASIPARGSHFGSQPLRTTAREVPPSMKA